MSLGVYCRDQRGERGGSPLNFDGDTNDWNWAARRTAKRTVEISTIFRRVFGSGAMMARVRPVLESQEGYVAFWAAPADAYA